MEHGQNYTEVAAEHLRKTQVVFRECARMCVVAVVMEGHAPSVG